MPSIPVLALVTPPVSAFIAVSPLVLGGRQTMDRLLAMRKREGATGLKAVAGGLPRGQRR
jgi:hypothetical protein